MVMDAGLPLPEAKRIVPRIVAYWNAGKGPIDEMSGYLSKVHFVVARLPPKPTLIIRELKKIALSSFLVQKHCFPLKEVKQGSPYSAIVRQHSKHEGTFKSFCYELATTYKIRDQLSGKMVPSSPALPADEELSNEEEEDAIDGQLQSRNEIKQYQRDCRRVCREVKHNRLKQFLSDNNLSAIRLDRCLSHHPTKYKQLPGDKQIRGSCAVCMGTESTLKPATYYCYTCMVPLCMVVRGKQTCFQKFHSSTFQLPEAAGPSAETTESPSIERRLNFMTPPQTTRGRASSTPRSSLRRSQQGLPPIPEETDQRITRSQTATGTAQSRRRRSTLSGGSKQGSQKRRRTT